MSQAKERIIANRIVAEPEATAPTVVESGRVAGRRSVGAMVGSWGRDEGGRWRRVLGGFAPLVLLFGALLLLGLAWQVPFSYTLDASTELNLDQPFLHNFRSEIERTDKTPQGQYFRWSKGEGSLLFPGIGRRDYRVQLTLAGSANPNPTYILYANSQKLAEGKLEAGLKSYVFDVPAGAISNKNGDLQLRLEVPSFQPPGDSRELGFVFFSAKLDATDTGLIVPPLEQLGLLVGLIMLVYALLGRAGFAPWRAAGGAAFGAAVLAYVIATPGVRVWLTIFSTQLAYAFGLALLLVVALDVPMRRVWGSGWEARWTLTFFGLAFAFRLAAALHPQAGGSIVDLGFHAHRMAALWDQHLWWDKITSTEWGNRQTYYPHTVHLLAGLFQWLIPDRNLLLLTWMNIFEASRVLLVFYLVKRATGDGRSAVFAAFFMAALPINMLSLEWGQVANLFAEWLVLVALCMAVVRWEELRKVPLFVVLTLTLLASFIVHPGEVLLSGIVFGAIGLVFWRTGNGGRQARIFLASYLLAIGLAFASYHWVTVRDMIPEALDSFNSRLQGNSVSSSSAQTGFRTGGSVSDSRMGFIIKKDVKTVPEMLVEGVKGFWREIRIYFDVFPVLMLPWALWWLWRTSRRDNSYGPFKQRLFWAGVIWTITAVVFAIVGLLLNLYVRYSLFMLPFVAIGAGLFLGRLWQRQTGPGQGWAIRLFVVALGGWITVGTLALLLDRVIYYLHGL